MRRLLGSTYRLLLFLTTSPLSGASTASRRRRHSGSSWPTEAHVSPHVDMSLVLHNFLLTAAREWRAALAAKTGRGR